MSYQRTLATGLDGPLPNTGGTKPKLLQDACPTSPEYSDDALAREFTKNHGRDLRYTEGWGCWSVWNGHVWVPGATNHVLHLARTVCTAASARCDDQMLARKIASAATVSAVVRLACADPLLAATVELWDANPMLLNTPGGVLDLGTGRLRPAEREDYLTKMTAVAPGGGCPLWLSSLDRITKGNRALRGFLQRVCGYALTGVTTEQVFFFLYGTGKNGKGTFVDTAAGILGDYARTAAIETFLDSKNERHPTELAWLKGARFVTATETEGGRRWSEAKVKLLTGGDPIAARFMRKDFFEYVPQFKLIIQGNHKPGLRSVDEAIRRRFILVPFTVTIPEPERDKNLREKLREEWSGILQWAVEGCLAWQREGLNAPDVVKSPTNEYLSAEDAMGRWIEESCVVLPNAVESVSALYADWHKWAEKNGEFAGSLKAFSQGLESRDFKPGRTSTARTFRGLAMRSAGPTPVATNMTRSPIYPHAYARTHEPNMDDPSQASHSSPEPGAGDDGEGTLRI
jgi:putative DNA primase/helicase